MKLADTVAALLSLASDRPPTAVEIEGHFRGQATARATASENLDHPTWTGLVNGPDDVYLTLDGDLAGIQIWEDPRGWGAYAELAVMRGTLADVESIVGPMQPMPRAPDDFHSGQKAAAYVERAGRTVRVFAELAGDNRRVVRVTVCFPSRDEPARAR